MSASDRPELDDVLEAFMLDASEEGALARYLCEYPQFAGPLLQLAHEVRRDLPDEYPALDAAGRAAIEAGWVRLDAAWPAEARSLFAGRSPAEYGRVATELRVPRQLISALRDGRVILETVPGGFLRRLASALGGTIDELLASIGARPALARSYKAEQRPAPQEPVPFEQAMVEARVPEERRIEILADVD